MLNVKDLRTTQKDCIEFVKDGYESLVLADVGTGKTVIALTALASFMNHCEHDRALILAPKRVCTDVWMQEIREWGHLIASGLTAECAAGKTAIERCKIIDGDADIVLLNYENLPWLAENYPKPPFNVLVCDEIDKLKSRKINRFKGRSWTDSKGIKRKYDGMRKYRKHFETIIGLTGTPRSNCLLDLWAQVFIIDGGVALGKSFDKFQDAHFYPTDYRRFSWEIIPGHEKIIYDAIRHLTFRIERDADIPPMVELPPRFVELPFASRKRYKKFEREYLVILENGDHIESPNAAAAYGKCRQMASGFAYLDDDDEIEKRTVKDVEWFDEAKFIELNNLISELSGQQLIIVYHFKAQLVWLQEKYKALQYLGGGVSDKKATQTMADWNEGSLQLLALHPASAGHGLNLQKSGAHHIVMLTEPESAGLYEQVVGRLRRTGNNAPSIFVHRILTRNTVDIEQDLKVHGKIKNQDEFLKAMKNRT